MNRRVGLFFSRQKLWCGGELDGFESVRGITVGENDDFPQPVGGGAAPFKEADLCQNSPEMRSRYALFREDLP